MQLSIESELEDDGRWLAEVPQLPGVLAYGETRDQALERDPDRSQPESVH